MVVDRKVLSHRYYDFKHWNMTSQSELFKIEKFHDIKIGKERKTDLVINDKTLLPILKLHESDSCLSFILDTFAAAFE